MGVMEVSNDGNWGHVRGGNSTQDALKEVMGGQGS